jgi:tetratricopeptide (TPR) repeat protein
MKRPTPVFVAALTALALCPAWAQSPAKAPELGVVSFPTSCDPAVQAAFERGVAMLHSFWFAQAGRTFRGVLERDPGCAIAAWGIATNLIGNPLGGNSSVDDAKRAREVLERGRAIGPKTERERFYIEAVAEYWDRVGDRSKLARMKSLAKAFGILAERFPEDDEAQIFHALYLTATQSPTDKSFAPALQAAAILELQFTKHPDHPGVAHYLIHSYDYPPIAERGLAAARRYAGIAPSAPHALHMPSHIFTRVGAWKESAETNLRGAAVAKAEKSPGDRLHAMDYMVYAYLQLARDHDALRVVNESRSITGLHPGHFGNAYALAAMPARAAVERGRWKDAEKLEPRASRFPQTEAITHFARALGAARSGDAEAAGREEQELARIVKALRAAKNPYWAAEVDVQRLAAAGWTAHARGELDKALALMRSAADAEDRSEKSAVTPGRLVPARELLADMLLETGKPAEALAEYERSQVHDPNRYRGLYGAGQAAAQSGSREKARYYYARLIALADPESPRSELPAVREYLAHN